MAGQETKRAQTEASKRAASENLSYEEFINTSTDYKALFFGFLHPRKVNLHQTSLAASEHLNTTFHN